ncbi:hypothetical protein B5F77_01110 [Parabacteroides sp. An277]|uniref:PCMD domain-containing protein n=1 Tax=Parabacteroides sp. An277 TaxID=1965619 RepID=UPI000B389692|nr:PCMD domain-containing protein [Parabacteroides sp. An277]OUO55484.1 hypothetical protein B5F77_01110 [Parabacteroides sp. An277]
MKHKEFIKRIALGLCGIGFFASCAIENDIPYPIVESAITGMTVEGQRSESSMSFAAASIDNSTRSVQIYVNDSVDITNLRITQLQISNNAELLVDSAVCTDYSRFPDTGFASLDSVARTANTRIDFTNPVKFTLRTYQDYEWTVTVNQIIQRDIEIDGLRDYTIDVTNRRAVVYVDPTKDLSNIQFTTLNLGGYYGEVIPVNGGSVSDIRDYTSPQEFYVRLNWEPENQYTRWTVYVLHSDTEVSTETTLFPMSATATLSGTIQSGQTPVIEYREQGSSSWQTLSTSSIVVSGTSYTATFSGLTPGQTYQYRVTANGTTSEEQSFTTVAAVALENGSLENWSEGTLTSNTYYIPNAEGETFWGTGNSATAIYNSNVTTPTDDSYSGKAAELKSQSALGVKMAAGNLFTGDFERDGLDGILQFGRSFSSFPTALRLYYKYTTAPMQTVGSLTSLPSNLESLVGRPDSCHIYIALSDKSEPYEIRTKANNRQLFDKNDANIIAYGEYISAENVTSYQQIEIPLVYRAYRTPRYIIIVCSSSKYGDYYLAGEGSTLWLDEMELVYE